MRLMWDLAFEVLPERAEAAESWQFSRRFVAQSRMYSGKPADLEWIE
jgi:hypothetical protein